MAPLIWWMNAVSGAAYIGARDRRDAVLRPDHAGAARRDATACLAAVGRGGVGRGGVRPLGRSRSPASRGGVSRTRRSTRRSSRTPACIAMPGTSFVLFVVAALLVVVATARPSAAGASPPVGRRADAARRPAADRASPAPPAPARWRSCRATYPACSSPGRAARSSTCTPRRPTSSPTASSPARRRSPTWCCGPRTPPTSIRTTIKGVRDADRGAVRPHRRADPGRRPLRRSDRRRRPTTPASSGTQNGPGDRYVKLKPVPVRRVRAVAQAGRRHLRPPRPRHPARHAGRRRARRHGHRRTPGSATRSATTSRTTRSTRRAVDGGAQLLVVQTSNAAFTGTSQPEQQWDISRLRAIETGRWVVVPSTNGISGVVDPDGDVVQRAPLHEPATHQPEGRARDRQDSGAARSALRWSTCW